MKRHRNTAQMKGQTRNTSPKKWRGYRKIIWKRTQNNDSKDDQKPWKQNGENARINYQRPRRIKEWTYRDNTVTEIKNTLEGINSRISKAEEWIQWAGR